MGDKADGEATFSPWYRHGGTLAIGLAIAGTVTHAAVAAVGGLIGAVCWRLIRQAGGTRKDADSCILGTVASTLVAVAMVALPPAMAKMNDESGRAICLAHQRLLYQAMSVYHDDHDDTYPLADNWCDAITAENPPPLGAFVCPRRLDLESGFAMNERVAGVRHEVSRPDGLVIAFESDLGWNGVGYSDAFVARHGSYGAVIGAGGVMQWLKAEQLPSIQWDP